MKKMMLFVFLVTSSFAFGEQKSSDHNVNVASCCDSCYLRGTPGAVPCNPSLAKIKGAATFTSEPQQTGNTNKASN